MTDKQSQAEANRRAHPDIADLVDKVREIYPGAVVVRVKLGETENG